MKKTMLALLILFAGMDLSAQYCGSPHISSCGLPSSTYGFGDPNSYPCIASGLEDSILIHFKCYTNFTAQGNSVQVFKLRIDSIDNLPCGMCWSTNKATNEFLPDEDGCLMIKGLTTDLAGQYRLRLIISIATVNASTYDIIRLDASAGNINLIARVSVGGPCDTVNYNIAGNTAGICHPLPVASITAGGPVSFCEGDSVTLAASPAVGYRYHWSTGDTSQSILARYSGSYTVTVYNATDTLVSPPLAVLQNLPFAHFQLMPDPTTAHVWVAVNQCTGNNLSYSWVWGDQSPVSTTPTPSHTYSDTGYYTICVGVTDSAGCSSRYCDSTVYLYKEQNQMIQMNVVQYALGLNEAAQNTLSVKYYGGSLHFALSISSPSEVRLYDASGRVVMKESHWTGSTLPVDAALSSGVYITVLQNHTSSLSKKITIIR